MSQTAQPDWECVAQIGDASPTEYGGLWIFRDKTGVYTEEAELLICPETDSDAPTNLWYVHRFILDRCTYQNGILSDNKYHPDHPAWFAKPESERAKRPQDTTYLADVVAGADEPTVEKLIEQLCSEDPVERAMAYREIGEYHGWDNFDHNPLFLRKREMKKRYKNPKYEVMK